MAVSDEVITQRFLTVPDFFDGAEQAREVYERHFRRSMGETTQDRFYAWNYMYFPGMFNILVSTPARILPSELCDRFAARIDAWAQETFGLFNIPEPWFSVYLDGCEQTPHSHSGQWLWAWVYSLTRWDQRTFKGGETVLFKDSFFDYWRTDQARTASGAVEWYQRIPPRFNQLLAFDARTPHAVQGIQGTMDPLEARVMITGYLHSRGPVVRGSLTREQVLESVGPALETASEHLESHPDVHGLVSVRLSVEPDGRVASARALVDTLVYPGEDPPEETLRDVLVRRVRDVRFAPASGPSRVTLPILAG